MNKDRVIQWCEWWPEEPHDRFGECTVAEAIAGQRKFWAQKRPGLPDPRTDEECLEEFMVVHWAWFVDSFLGANI